MMLQDLRFAVRLFARQRAFSLTAILTIALGVGLSATVFAVVDGVLFRPLPYRDPGRLVAVYGVARAPQPQTTLALSYLELGDWREARAFEQLEGYGPNGLSARVRGADETTQVRTSVVTGGFLDMLGVRPVIGRTLGASDFEPGAPPVALVSYRIWRAAFGGDPDVLGRTLERGDVAHTIVGVLPRTFVFPIPSRRFAPEVVVPFDMASASAGDRRARILYSIGRLAPGATMTQAQTELDAMAVRLKPLFPASAGTHAGAFDGANLMDLRDQMTLASRTVLWLVFAAAAMVFLISCVNVVGLLLAQGEERRRELAVRTALGAARTAIVRQLVIEAALLAAAGAAAGWLVSAVTFDALARRIPQWLQLLGDPGMDARVVVFAVIMAALTVLVAGVMPALRSSSDAPRAALAGGGRHGSAVRRGRHALLLVEVALATVLLCAGSIMVRGYLTLTAEESGMDADRVIAVRSTPPGLVDVAARNRYNARMAEAIARVPGVEAVSFIDMPLLQSMMKGSNFEPPALQRPMQGPGGIETDVVVTPSYFSTMGVAIRMGRGLTDADRGTGVVISETVARRYWPGRNPVGETIRYGKGTREIVGVAGDARDVSFERPPTPTLYHVWDERAASIATVVARFSGDPDRVVADIRRAVRETEPAAAITMLATIEDLISVSIAPRTFNTLLFAVFGTAGLIVALVGIYGLVSFLVARREREMGIRLALGASATGLKVFVLSGILRWVGAGIAIGVLAALLLAQYLKPFVYQIPANDPLTLAMVAVAFILVAAAASYVPARRAARVDPMIALRAE
jgi:putative ABC transport system permease protein